jgi:Glutaredoxin-like domain (DUF836)
MAAAPPAAAYLSRAGTAPSCTIGAEMIETPHPGDVPLPEDAPVPDLVLYSRPACDLCDEARRILKGLLAERAGFSMPTPRLIERDIDTDPDWQRAYFTSIPVVEFAGRRIELATSAAKLRALLHDVLDA